MNQIIPLITSGLGALIMIEGYLSLYAASLISLYVIGVCLLFMFVGGVLIFTGLDVLARMDPS